MHENNDTLNIRPHHPGHHPEPGHQSQPMHQRTDKNPDLADAARLKIENLTAKDIIAGQSRGQIPEPVSPVEEEHRSKLARKLEKPRPLPSRIKPIISAVASFLLLVLLFKSPVIISQVNYLFSKPNTNTIPVTTQTATSNASDISIPKIQVQAPLLYPDSADEATIQQNLQNGVVHYAGTAVPGQNGNAVYVGHSSNDPWEPGHYKFVFVLLDKLQVGDNFSIDYNGTKYVYQVTDTKIVPPTDVGVLNPTSDPQVTLITCDPPGTSVNRLVVTAKQISPSPKDNKAFNPSTALEKGQMLPSNPPGFFQQVGQAWTSLKNAVVGLFGGQPNQPNEVAPPTTLPST